MAAERRRITFRYRCGELVGYQGRPDPYVILTQEYLHGAGAEADAGYEAIHYLLQAVDHTHAVWVTQAEITAPPSRHTKEP